MVPSSPRKSVCSGSSMAVLREEDCRHLGFRFGGFWISSLAQQKKKRRPGSSLSLSVQQSYLCVAEMEPRGFHLPMASWQSLALHWCYWP